MSSSKLYIIDASGYLYRAYHAIGSMTNSQGESTNALFGFIRCLFKLNKDFHPDFLVAVFDGPNNAKKRKELYPAYKANRTSMPEDLGYQMDWAREFCKISGIPLLNIPEAEADDVMGSVAVWAAQTKAFDEIYLCTSDKDMAQLVTPSIYLLNTHKDNLLLDAKGVEENYGVPPDKIIDLLAITGDSSDNIPGLPGFGPKTAISLLQQFPSLEYILDHPEEVPGKKKQETIIQEADKARISKKLVTLDTAVAIPQDPTFFQIKEEESELVRQFHQRMNFASFLKEQGFENSKQQPIPAEEVSYTLVDSEASLDKLLALLETHKEICVDTETTAIDPMQASLVGVGFCVSPQKAWYIPLNGPIERATVLVKLKKLLENKHLGFYGHNLKYDYQVFLNEGIKIANIVFDTIIASYILNSNNRQHSLDALSLQYFSKVKIATSTLLGKGKTQVTMLDVPIQQVCDYCCEDVDYTCRLKALFEVQLEERRLMKLYKTLELPLLIVLARMERHGIYLDVPFLHKMALEVNLEINRIAETIYEDVGETFNLNSPKQLGQILFEKMGIAPPKKTATGFSTDAEVLETLAETYPLARTLLEYRSLEKLRSTYIESLPLMVNLKTHRIHCTFNQVVAATGRLSCQDPNLQNIPARSEVGLKIREAFRPEKQGYSFLSADYSQIELRLLAHFSGDPNLIEAFKRNEDIHAHTAASIFGVPMDQVTKEMRHRAKAVNFGVIYGQQAFGLARELGIDFKEAKAFIDLYFERFPTVKTYIEECKEKARATGRATTYTGRERALPEILSKNPQIRAAAERLAVNTPLQGSAADLIKTAMLTIDKLLHKEGYLGYMILQIHDELIFELPDFELPGIESLVKNTMEQALTLKVPLIVNISIGKNWKEC